MGKQYEVQGPRDVWTVQADGAEVFCPAMYAVAEVGHTSPDWAFCWSEEAALHALEELNSKN